MKRCVYPGDIIRFKEDNFPYGEVIELAPCERGLEECPGDFIVMTENGFGVQFHDDGEFVILRHADFQDRIEDRMS